MKAPVCPASGTLHSKRDMRLVHETEKFWTFGCPCGCLRAYSKPSVKAQAAYQKEKQAVDRLRQEQNRGYTAYSFAARN